MMFENRLEAGRMRFRVRMLLMGSRRVAAFTRLAS